MRQRHICVSLTTRRPGAPPTIATTTVTFPDGGNAAEINYLRRVLVGRLVRARTSTRGIV